MDTVKNSILALFDDNVVGAISAQDMRIFVEAVFESKENEIHVFEDLSDLVVYRQTQGIEYPIEKFDLIAISDPQDKGERGLYIALKDNPAELDVLKIANVNYDEFLKLGQTGQLISLDSENKLTWIDPLPGYFIEGTDTIYEILQKRPNQVGPIWIASDTDLTAPVPGEEGDGYSWTGTGWTNIGPMRGPEGDVVNVAMATQMEVNAGFVDDKGISPKTFQNSDQLQRKEGSLGLPNNDGDVLSSSTSGQRSWITPVKYLDDLDDVDLSDLLSNSILYYDGTKWLSDQVSNISRKKFIDLDDTPNSYAGQGYKGVMVNPAEDALMFVTLVTRLKELLDVSGLQPQHDQVLKYNATKNLWEPGNDTMVGTTQERPINADPGLMFFDRTLNKPIFWTGVNWVDALGATL